MSFLSILYHPPKVYSCKLAASNVTMKHKRAALLWILLVNIYLPLRAQQDTQRSAGSAEHHAIEIFARAAGPQSPVFNGVEYKRYPSFIHSGHPFFIADSLINGSVTIDGVTYRNVPLQYDESIDELITTDVQGNNLVQISRQQVERFSIGQHDFVHLSAKNLRPGYYRLLYNGNSQIIAKESKLIQVKTGRTTAETERWVNASIDYFMKSAKGYEKFNRLNSFLALFGSYQKQVAGFIRERKLRSSSDRENLYREAASYYDQLTD